MSTSNSFESEIETNREHRYLFISVVIKEAKEKGKIIYIIVSIYMFICLKYFHEKKNLQIFKQSFNLGR